MAFLDKMLLYLEFIHKRGVVHRDIKPENILLANNTYFLVDFGIAKSSDRTLTGLHPWGSETWAPPEQLAGLGTDNRTDLYSLGATAYWLLTGTYINNFNKDARQRERVLQRLSARPDVPRTLAQTLIDLLQINLTARPKDAKDAHERLYPPLPPPQPRRKKRRTGAIVLAALLLAALGTCGYAAINNPAAIGSVMQGVREGFNGVDVLPSPSPSVARTPFPANSIQQQIDAAGGTWGVVVIDLASNTTVYTHNADTAFPVASLAKLPIVLAAYQLAQQGELDLDEQLTLEAEDKVGGTGTLQGEPAGTRYTIRDLCRRMLSESDNTAGNMVLGRLGFDAVNRITAELGAETTQLQRRFDDLEAQAAGQENIATAADIARLLQALIGGGVLTGAQRTELLDALRSTERDKLAQLLPPNTDIAHKTGVLSGVEHDAGIVRGRAGSTSSW